MINFDSPGALDFILRYDFASFIAKTFQTVSPGPAFQPNWHIQAIAWHLDQVRLGRIRRLIIAMPPRSLKSIAASVAFPAHILGHDPRQRLICISYSNDLASKHTNDFREVLRSPWYQRVYPLTRIDRRKDTETEVATTERGFRFSTSTTGTLTGRGGHIIIIDDPLKPADAMSDARRDGTNEWFSHTLLSRADDKRDSAIIIVMQRLHMNDLVGHVQELSDDWTVLALPAIADHEHRVQIGDNLWHTRKAGDLLHPEREPLKALEELRAALGSEHFSAQYQQDPIPPGGAAIKRDWIKRYATPPPRDKTFRVFQSWDTAVQIGESNDWSVGTTWMYQEGKYYLIDVKRARLEYPDLKREVEALAARYESDAVLVENTSLGAALVQDMRFQRYPLIPIIPTRDKVSRLAVQAAKFEAGQVFLPERASWLTDFEKELFSFPQAKYDDQVDSVSQFLEWASQPRALPRVRRL